MAYASNVTASWRSEVGDGLWIKCLTPSFYMEGVWRRDVLRQKLRSSVSLACAFDQLQTLIWI